MLYLIVGTGNNVQKEIGKVSGEKPVFKMDTFSWDADIFRSKLEGSSLFGVLDGEEGEVLVLDNVSENIEAWDTMKLLAKEVVDLEKKVIIVEQVLDKEDLGFFENLGAKVSDLRQERTREYDFSPFALQDAVGVKSAKSAWIEYMKLIEMGIEPEEIAPRLVTKARDMLAITRGALKEDLGIKSDFPFNKSKKDSKNWKESELKSFYTKLVSIYHESRMGGEDLEIALEKELLRI